MDELELVERSRPEAAPSPEVVARHRLALAEAMGSAPTETYAAAEAPRRRVWLTALTAAAVVLAGVGAGLLLRGDDTPTRVVTAPPAGQPTATTTARGGIVGCGSRYPAAISEGRYEHDHHENDPESISVRIYACRVETDLPESVTGPDGRTREMITTLRELMERFGGLEGSVLDEFGRAHPISLAPLAGADPDTTAIGLIWSVRPQKRTAFPAGPAIGASAAADARTAVGRPSTELSYRGSYRFEPWPSSAWTAHGVRQGQP